MQGYAQRDADITPTTDQGHPCTITANGLCLIPCQAEANAANLPDQVTHEGTTYYRSHWNNGLAIYDAEAPQKLAG